MPDIVGTGFEGRADVIRSYVKQGMPVILKRDWKNKYDPNAIAVYIQAPVFLWFGSMLRQIGFVDKERASKMAPKMDAGEQYDAHVLSFYADMKYPRVTVSWRARGS